MSAARSRRLAGEGSAHNKTVRLSTPNAKINADLLLEKKPEWSEKRGSASEILAVRSKPV